MFIQTIRRWLDEGSKQQVPPAHLATADDEKAYCSRSFAPATNLRRTPWWLTPTYSSIRMQLGAVLCSTEAFSLWSHGVVLLEAAAMSAQLNPTQPKESKKIERRSKKVCVCTFFSAPLEDRRCRFGFAACDALGLNRLRHDIMQALFCLPDFYVQYHDKHDHVHQLSLFVNPRTSSRIPGCFPHRPGFRSNQNLGRSNYNAASLARGRGVKLGDENR